MGTLSGLLPPRLAADPLREMSTDSDLEAVADAVIELTEHGDNEQFWENAAKRLLLACLGYLRDWCTREQRNLGNLVALVRAAVPGDDGRSKLDGLFEEIRTGCSWDGEAWSSSMIERQDGVRPCDTNGLAASDDYALGNYFLFVKSVPLQVRRDVALRLCTALDK